MCLLKKIVYHLVSKTFYNLIAERMNKIEKLHNSIDFNNLTHYYRGLTFDINFDNFIDAITLFNEIKSSRIKLNDAKKIKWILNQN